MVWQELELLLRLLVAGICGAAIGFERKSRLKEAGIRTHFIVAMASALMMIISKYGFFDVLEGEVKLDPSRVASSIISGVGFLGAGMIFVRKQAINGLTTAAGIWAISGIGMAVGAGMYFMGIASTFVILLAQVVLHRDNRFTKNYSLEFLRVVAENTPETISQVNDILIGREIEIVNIKLETGEKGTSAIMDFSVRLPKDFAPSEFSVMFGGNPKIKSFDY